jgi:glycosyltransferase involved in cell wall biosynthesis
VTVAIPTYNRSSWLRGAIMSALSQTYADFRVVVGDNASTDDTERVVRSLEDDRIDYVRRPSNVGSQENFNRLLEDVTTEYVIILPDDDWLYPGYLEATVSALDANPTAGFADTAFDAVDRTGRITLSARHRFPRIRGTVLEDGVRFRRRAMKEDWPVCWPTALLRTRAAQAAGPFRAEDGDVVDDFGLFLRMSGEWDVVHLPTSLVAFRIHDTSTTAQFAAFSEGWYVQPLSHYELLRDIRLRTIDELELPPREARRLRRRALATHRRALVTERAMAASHAEQRLPGLRSVRELAVADRRILLVPRTWRLVAADLGGRRLKYLLHSAKEPHVQSGEAASTTDDATRRR